MDQQLWGEMLDVLKDIGGYLTKQDAEQTRAKLDKAPKNSENQADEPIVGGDAPTGKPGTGVAKSVRKSMVDAGSNPKNTKQKSIAAEGTSFEDGTNGITNAYPGDGFTNEEEEGGLDEGGYDDEGGGLGGVLPADIDVLGGHGA